MNPLTEEILYSAEDNRGVVYGIDLSSRERQRVLEQVSCATIPNILRESKAIHFGQDPEYPLLAKS